MRIELYRSKAINSFGGSTIYYAAVDLSRFSSSNVVVLCECHGRRVALFARASAHVSRVRPAVMRGGGGDKRLTERAKSITSTDDVRQGYKKLQQQQT